HPHVQRQLRAPRRGRCPREGRAAHHEYQSEDVRRHPLEPADRVLCRYHITPRTPIRTPNAQRRIGVRDARAACTPTTRSSTAATRRTRRATTIAPGGRGRL